MQKFYISYKALFVAAILCGIYLPSIEKIYGSKWYIRALKYLFLVPFLSLSAYLLSCLKYVLFDSEGKLEEVLHGSFVLVYTFFSFFTTCSFYFNTVNLEKLFELWESLFQQEFFTEQRQAILEKNRKFALNWLKKFGGISITCAIIYGIFPYFNAEKKLEHPTGIPYRSQSPDFELVVTLELLITYFGFFTPLLTTWWSIIIISYYYIYIEAKIFLKCSQHQFNELSSNLSISINQNMIVYDSMTMVLLSLEEAQFLHLKKSLSHIVEFISVTESGAAQIKVNEISREYLNEVDGNSPLLKEKFEEAERYILIWIYHHKQILQFHEELKKIFFFPFAVKFFVLVLIICLLFFLVVTGNFPPIDVAISLIFCANIYATFYVTISFADSTKETAETIFEEAFDKSWHLFPKNLKTGFNIILMRCHRPVNYTAFKIYPLTAASFLKIFTSAYTFFTFLLQINWKKKREFNQPN